MKREAILTGVKILVAVVSGVAIFFGINSVSKSSSNNSEEDRTNAGPSVGEEVVSDLRKARESSNNAARFLNALSSVAEEGLVLFGKSHRYDHRNTGYRGYRDELGLRRRSSYVIEAVGESDIYDDNYDNHYGKF